MDLQDAQKYLDDGLKHIGTILHKLPGSTIFVRYIRSSYQNDPARSAIELAIVLFFVTYLLKPRSETKTRGHVELTEEEIDDMVDEWQPEPLVAKQTAFEEWDQEKLPVIVGFVMFLLFYVSAFLRFYSIKLLSI